MSAQRTKQLTSGCAHSKGKPGVPASTTNISVRFAPDFIFCFRIEGSVKTSIQNPPACSMPRSVMGTARRLAVFLDKP